MGKLFGRLINAPLLAALPRRRTISISGLPSFRFEMHGANDTIVSRTICRDGMWEAATSALLLNLLDARADMLDVGANIGWHTIIAAHKLGSRGRIHSFEPEQANLRRLRANVALSGLTNIVVNAWALSDRTGRQHLNLNPTNLGDHRLGSRSGRRSVVVPIRRLDDYQGVRGLPLVIKLDVQGSEWHVLEGGRGLLRDHPHDIVLVCEIAPTMLEDAGASLGRLIDLLAGHGFAAALIDQSSSRIQPTGWEQLRARLVAAVRSDPDHSEDIVAFRRPDGLMRAIFSPR